MLARSLSKEMVAAATATATDGCLSPEPELEPEPEPQEQALEATDSFGDELSPQSSSGRLCATCSGCKCLHPQGNHLLSHHIERTLSDQPPRTLSGTPDSLSRARSESSAHIQLTAEKNKNRALRLEMRDAAGQERLVAFDIDPRELGATWDDQMIHGAETDWQRAHRGHTKDSCCVCQGETDLWRICHVTSRTWDSLSPAQRERKQRTVARLRRQKSGDPPYGSTESTSDDDDEDAAMRTTSVSNLEESKGVHGVVRRAVWKNTIKVAIKENVSEKSNDEEMKLFRDLHHPHIVTCYGILREQRDGKPTTSIVTEQCTTSLSKFLRDDQKWAHFRGEPLSNSEISLRKLTILEHVSQGLDRLHDLSVLHRDIKCQNILLDGEPGTCATCGHAGRWKICDFGEATILRTPMLTFQAPKVWRGTVSKGRYQPITSVELRACDATHYCWIHPGETFAAIAGDDSLPTTAKDLGLLDLDELKQRARELRVPQQWIDQTVRREDLIQMVLCPFPDGALVYSFSAREHEIDPNEPDTRDCVFSVSQLQSCDEDQRGKTFPEALQPFSVVPWTELKADQMERCVSLDLSSCTYSITLDSFCGPKLPPQLTCLKSLYESRGGTTGTISEPRELQRTTPLKVTSSSDAQLPETKYHVGLPQESNGKVIPQDRACWCCDKTGDRLGEGPGKTMSLWLNLSDGFIGGGRQSWGAGGGNGTAVEHYKEMLEQGKNYPLAVKLGTITADGADVYSYATDEDESVHVPAHRLAELLGHWGIDMTKLVKTEKAMQELELEEVEEALLRRRERIPKNATHYVWAYQLEPWVADKSFKHLDILQQQSGEISLASYGGKIYFTYDERTGEPIVVGINAITVIGKETARPEYVGGVVNRAVDDFAVSPPVASPELFEGTSIGLETDIYAFGIVMWECFTRREAWHWIPNTPHKKLTIELRVGEGKRPKIPQGLDDRGFVADGQNFESISEMIRKCLHHDPSYRPSAKRLKDWIGKCCARLRWSIEYRKRMQESEREQLRRALSTSLEVVFRDDAWSVVDIPRRDYMYPRNLQTHWNWKHGRYSVDAFQANFSVDAFPDKAEFRLSIKNQTRDDWEENALTGEKKEPVLSKPNNEPVPVEPLGIIFDKWPIVARIQKKDNRKTKTLASRYPELTSGCILKQINGEDVPKRLEFSAAFNTEGDLGLVFSDKWPTVKSIKTNTMASQVPGLHVGCTLLRINSVPIGSMTFNEAKMLTVKRPCIMLFSPKDPMVALNVCVPQLFSRPLVLTFSSRAVHATMDVVAPWHREAMRCIAEVRAHEKQHSTISELAAAHAEIANLRNQLARLQAVPAESQPQPDDGTRPTEPEPQEELLPQQRSAPQLGEATFIRRVQSVPEGHPPPHAVKDADTNFPS